MNTDVCLIQSFSRSSILFLYSRVQGTLSYDMIVVNEELINSFISQMAITS
jgi:hypothetical protein